MELEIWLLVLLCVAYFCGGFVDSIAGGGGLIAIPAFLLTGVPPEQALGTNKMAAVFGTSVALYNYASNQLVPWKIILPSIPVALLGGFLGTKTLLLFDSETIGKIILFMLPLAMVVTLIPKKKKKDYSEDYKPFQIYVIAPLIALLVGFYEGFFGPGSGSFFLLGFHLLIGMGMVKASAAAKAFNLTAAVSAFAVYIYSGNILFMLGIPITICNVAGNALGSRMAIRIGPGFVKKILLFSLSLLMLTLIGKFYLDF